MIKLVKLTETVYVNPDEIVSLESEKNGYDETSYTIITLTTGRKIYIRSLTVSEVSDKLKGEKHE